MIRRCVQTVAPAKAWMLALSTLLFGSTWAEAQFIAPGAGYGYSYGAGGYGYPGFGYGASGFGYGAQGGGYGAPGFGYGYAPGAIGFGYGGYGYGSYGYGGVGYGSSAYPVFQPYITPGYSYTTPLTGVGLTPLGVQSAVAESAIRGGGRFVQGPAAAVRVDPRRLPVAGPHMVAPPAK